MFCPNNAYGPLISPPPEEQEGFSRVWGGNRVPVFFRVTGTFSRLADGVLRDPGIFLRGREPKLHPL